MTTNDEVKKIFEQYGYVMRTAELRTSKIYYEDIQRLMMGKMDKEIFNKAVQGYIQDPKKNITNLMRYAKPLRV